MRSKRNPWRGLAPTAAFCLLTSGCVIGIIDIDDDGPWDKEAITVVTRTVPLEGQDAFQLTGLNGNVVLTGVFGTNEITIRATKRVRSSSVADAEARLSDIRIVVHAGSHTVSVETDQPNHAGNRSYNVDYEITLPDDLFLSVANANGNVVAEGMRWETEVEVGNGNVEIVAGEGSTRTTVGNGNLTGDILLPDGGEIVFAVGNGSATLAVQREVSAELSAQVGNGTIVVSGLILQNQTSAPNQLRGTLGGGTGTIDLTVGNGNIRVSGG